MRSETDKNLPKIPHEDKPNLILTVGIPGSGKSTWIKSMSGYTIVSPDSIRAELGDISDQTLNNRAWAIAKERVTKALENNEGVILDATNLDSKYRRLFLKDLPEHNLIAKILKVDPEESKRRIKKDIENNVNRSNVPDYVIDRMHKSFEKTINDNQLEQEGFEVIN